MKKVESEPKLDIPFRVSEGRFLNVILQNKTKLCDLLVEHPEFLSQIEPQIENLNEIKIRLDTARLFNQRIVFWENKESGVYFEIFPKESLGYQLPERKP